MCTDLKYIDFVVRTKKGLFVERIFPDKMFWEHTVPKAKEEFYPSLLANGIRDHSHHCNRGISYSARGDSKEFCEGNMGKWLGVMMKNAAISGFTRNV